MVNGCGCDVSEPGHRTFPEVTSIWYIDLELVCARQEFIKIARLLVKPCGREDAAAPCVRLCTSIENVQKLRQQKKYKYCGVGLDISRVSMDGVRGFLQLHP